MDNLEELIALDGVASSDEISRCIIYERFFSSDGLAVDGFLWRFEGTTKDGCYHESAVLRRIAKDEEQVHEIGCGIAVVQNERLAEKLSDKPSLRRYYCGFRNATISSIKLRDKRCKVTFTLDGEGGVESHVDVKVEIKAQNKNEKNTLRMYAAMDLARAFGVPVPHRCACDECDHNHPFSRLTIACLMDGMKERWPKYTIADGGFIVDDQVSTIET